MKYRDGQTVTYYSHDIVFNAISNVWEYALIGWIYETKTLEEAKKDVKKNWRESQYFYRHCC
jgi:hypothetical protein